MDSWMETLWSSSQCGFHEWNEIWGDPLLSGSIMVFGYGLAGILLFRSRSLTRGRERLLWTVCGCILIFQAFNTPLDLHAFGWTFGKCLAHALDIYSAKRAIQFYALTSVAGLAIVITLSLAIIFRKVIWRNLMLLIGLVITTGFTLVKGISHHDLAAVYGKSVGPLHVADIIEISGIILILLAVLWRRNQLLLKRIEPD